jgi:predicted methyltransferase
MTTKTFAGTLDSVRLTRAGLSMIQLHDELWRVTRTDGEVLGYVERFAAAGGARYRAKRFLSRQRRFVGVGEFWSIDDAMDCFA